MEFKICIRTPHGQAKIAQKRLRPFILGSKIKPVESWVSPLDDELFWVIESDVKNFVRIKRNVTRFDQTIRKIVDSKPLKKLFRKNLDEKDRAELEDMLLNHTEVEIVTNATAEEIVEGTTTWWSKIKQKFKKTKEGEEGE